MPNGKEGQTGFYWIPSDNPEAKLQPGDKYTLRGDVTFTGFVPTDTV